MAENDAGQDALQTPLDVLGVMASSQGLLSPTVRQVEMYTRRGLLSLLWHEPNELTHNVGIVMMGGAMVERWARVTVCTTTLAIPLRTMGFHQFD
jgi:hypothetical protein